MATLRQKTPEDRPLLGAHMSIAGGVHNALHAGDSVGCEAIQIFTKSSRQWASTPLSEDDVRTFKDTRKTSGVHTVVAHDSYLLNLGAPDRALRQKSITAFVDEMERCEALGIPCLIAHPGAHTGAGERAGLRTIARSLDAIHRRCAGFKVHVALEITAGQGTNLGYRFEHIRNIIDSARESDRLRVCFDTQHAFAAGYDIRTREGYERTFAEFDETIGVELLAAFHLNDSKKELDCRVDRHEIIGQGHLDLEPFRLLMNDKRFFGLPMCLETPKSKDLKEDRETLELLRSFRAETQGEGTGPTRRSVIRAGLVALLAPPWLHSLSAPGAAAPAGLNDDEIVLGISAAFSGPSRGLGTELYRGAKSYFNHVNENGGVNGRKIVLRLYDDGYQPDPCVENTVKLMLEDRVFLLFGYVGTPTVTRVLPMLKKFQDQQVYLFFPFTGAQPQREPPYGDFAFNLRASYRQETAGLVNNFVRVGRQRIAMFYQADAYGRSGWAGVRTALERHGALIAGEATYRRGSRFTGSMRAQVEILKGADPDAVICVGAYAACAAFARDAVDLGLRVPIANLSFVGSENLLELLSEGRDDADAYTRFLVNSQVVPSYEDTSIPAVRQYREMMARYDPQVPGELVKEAYTPFPHSFVSLEGFLNAKLMVEILRRLKGKPDRAGLEEAVFSVRDFDLGIGEAASFGPERRQGLQKVYYTVVEDGRFVTLDDWKAKFG